MEASVSANEYLEFLKIQPDTAAEVAHVTPGQQVCACVHLPSAAFIVLLGRSAVAIMSRVK